MKIIATIEARMTSSRLPGKVLRPLAGKPMLQRLIERIKPARDIDEVIIATSDLVSDDPIARLANELNIGCFRGSLEDVLARLTRCAERNNADLIVKLSGDNPLYHYTLINDIVESFFEVNCDFLGTTFMGFSKAWQEQRTFPLGLGVAVIPLRVLQEADLSCDSMDDRESVVKYIIDRPEMFRLCGFHAHEKWAFLNRPELRLTVDTKEDFQLIDKIFTSLFLKNKLFGLQDVVEYLDTNTELLHINADVTQKGMINE